MKYAIDTLREAALRLFREDQALAFVISPPTSEMRMAQERTRARIARGRKKDLQQYIAEVRQHIRDRRKQFGVKAKAEHLIGFLEKAEAASPGNVLFAPLFMVRGFFIDYSQVWPDSQYLPAHARIIFDALGVGPGGETIRGIRLIEASIYEDMASLWNLLHERPHPTEVTTSSLPEQKTISALCRTTVACAVYFVEAYVNGLAFDHLSNNENTLSDEERSLLSDWDFGRQRPRYLSLRDKILRYQRIILRTEHAPIQPSNTSELQKILDTAELIRNPLAHPSPHFDPRTGAPDKELAIYGINIDTAQGCVDAAIATVRKIEMVIHGDHSRIPWLLQRGTNGTFPVEAFT